MPHKRLDPLLIDENHHRMLLPPKTTGKPTVRQAHCLLTTPILQPGKKTVQRHPSKSIGINCLPAASNHRSAAAPIKISETKFPALNN